MLALALALLGSLLAPAEADGVSTTDRFRAGEPYRGIFADPTVLRVGDRYVAAATTTANLNLPVLTSADLSTWHARQPLPNWFEFSEWRLYNDAMTHAPAWAATHGRRGPVKRISQWAPSLARVGGRYVAAYSAAVRLEPRHSCIGVATSPSAVGPYRNHRRTPLVCFRRAPRGAIDPDIFVDRGGAAYLLWKNEGVPRRSPPTLMVRRLAPSGTRFAPGSRPHALVRRDQRWEGGVVENPSMVRYRGRYLLLYSGNYWRTRRYATGYAVCRTPLGPCRKPTRRPLLSAGKGIAGTGGADGFVDHRGRLRMAYAAFDADDVGEGRPRRLYVATLALRQGRLRVIDRR